MSTHAISIFSSFQISLVSCRRFLWRKTGAKVQPFFIPAKYFFNFFRFFVRSGWFTICYVRKFFSGGVDMAGHMGRREGFFLDFSGELDMWRCGRITQVAGFPLYKYFWCFYLAILQRFAIFCVFFFAGSGFIRIFASANGEFPAR